MSPSRIEQRASEMQREEERIHQQQLQERQRKEREAAEKERQERVRRDREEAQRVKANIEKGKRIVAETGVLSHLTELKESLDPQVRKTAMLEAYDGDTARLSLAWGSKLAVENNSFTGEQGFFSGKKSDYSYITVELEINSERFRICNTTVDSNTWKNEPDALIDALVKAYRNPYRMVDRREQYSSSSSGYSYSSSSSSDHGTECCNT